ncbi:hypothetical protein OsJ_17490 [Oryza sativa Japonica Group]|uniref:Uncharacterized protein n=2 Tax=Oryza TaxID=4527 RepID=B9FIL7_ORYSJ|nr:hypothetical protein OsJ_17490 [Oryza sativa Japonica Group]
MAVEPTVCSHVLVLASSTPQTSLSARAKQADNAGISAVGDNDMAGSHDGHHGCEAHHLLACVGLLGAIDLAIHPGEPRRHSLLPPGLVLVLDINAIAVAWQQLPKSHLLREHHVHPLPAHLCTWDPPCPSYTVKNLVILLLAILFHVAAPFHRRLLRGGQEWRHKEDGVFHLPLVPDHRHRPMEHARRPSPCFVALPSQNSAFPPPLSPIVLAYTTNRLPEIRRPHSIPRQGPIVVGVVFPNSGAAVPTSASHGSGP